MRAPYSLQRGFSLVTAIFLLVVIAGLGAFALTLSSTQQQSSALDVLGSRAYQAARAGVEWGTYQIAQSAVVGPAFVNSCQAAGGTSAAVALTNTLAGFNVNVGCTAASAVEGTTTLWFYQLNATASQGVAGTSDYVERQMSATIEQ